VRQSLIDYLLDHIPEGDPVPEVRLVRWIHDRGHELLGVCSGEIIELSVSAIREWAHETGREPCDLLLQVFFHEYHHFLGMFIEHAMRREADLTEREREVQAESWAKLMMEEVGKGGAFVSRPDMKYLRRGEIQMRLKPPDW
jgi:hypothetical protein